MKPRSNRVLSLAVLGLIVVALLSVACAAQPTIVPAPAATTASTTAPATTAPPTTAPAATTAPKPAGPQVGGTLVFVQTFMDYNGLDPHSPGARAASVVLNFLESGLVTHDLMTGKIVGSLAESWNVSADGLTYDFKISKNAKFHDGTPITVRDYAFSIQRHKDPATKSPTAERCWGSVASAEAPDDNTLVIRMKTPDNAFIRSLDFTPFFCGPVPRHAIEQMGERFAQVPVLSGPFKFKEMQPGVKVVLERNPDFTWGSPPNTGPAYIQYLEIREVPEYATVLAGLEAGEIDLADIALKDVNRLTATGKITTVSAPTRGMGLTLAINVSKAPLDDVRVRKAINLAMDRQAMSKVISNGLNRERRGPVGPGDFGYWPGVEQIGYGFDLIQAKALMREAGYVPGSSGILEKDGKALTFTLKATAATPYDQLALLVKEQLKVLGIEVDIQQGPLANVNVDMRQGKFDLATGPISGTPNGVQLLNEVFHSSQIGGINVNRVSDPKLDELVAGARAATDEKTSLDLAAQAQKLIIEKAYSVPLLETRRYYAVSNRVKGLVANENTIAVPDLTGVYLEGGR